MQTNILSPTMTAFLLAGLCAGTAQGAPPSSAGDKAPAARASSGTTKVRAASATSSSALQSLRNFTLDDRLEQHADSTAKADGRFSYPSNVSDPTVPSQPLSLSYSAGAMSYALEGAVVVLKMGF
jgi:hypothetical protein